MTYATFEDEAPMPLGMSLIWVVVLVNVYPNTQALPIECDVYVIADHLGNLVTTLN